MTPFEIDRNKRQITVHGELTIFEVGEFHEALLSIGEDDGHLLIDLSDVDRVDSAGIQVLLVAAKSRDCRMCGVSQAVQEHLHRIGVTTLPWSVAPET